MLSELGINDQVVFSIFGSEEEFVSWFKAVLKDELENRQMKAAREAANALLQETQITIPDGL